MPTITLSKEEAQDLLWDSKDIIRNEITGQSRWSTQHELIFKRDGKFYMVYYSKGSTEYQEEYPFQDEDEVECQEVEPYEKTITDYRPI